MTDSKNLEHINIQQAGKKRPPKNIKTKQPKNSKSSLLRQKERTKKVTSKEIEKTLKAS